MDFTFTDRLLEGLLRFNDKTIFKLSYNPLSGILIIDMIDEEEKTKKTQTIDFN